MSFVDWARKLTSPKLRAFYHLTFGFVLASVVSLWFFYLEISVVGSISDEIDSRRVHFALLLFGTVFVFSGVLPVLVPALFDLLSRNKPELWRPGQSPLEAEILAHLTEEEKKGYARAISGSRWTWGLLVIVVGGFFAVRLLTDAIDINATFAFGFFVVVFVLLRFFGPANRFLASTQYARDKSISAHDLRFKRRRAL